MLLYLPTYSPWLNPIEMLWRHFRREVTHCESFESVNALIGATYEFFERYIRCPWRALDHRFEPRRNYVHVLRGSS